MQSTLSLYKATTTLFMRFIGSRPNPPSHLLQSRLEGGGVGQENDVRFF